MIRFCEAPQRPLSACQLWVLRHHGMMEIRMLGRRLASDDSVSRPPTALPGYEASEAGPIVLGSGEAQEGVLAACLSTPTTPTDHRSSMAVLKPEARPVVSLPIWDIACRPRHASLRCLAISAQKPFSGRPCNELGARTRRQVPVPAGKV